MAKYKITKIDEAKGLVTVEYLQNNGTVVLTDTRCDLPIEDKQAVDEILSRDALLIVADTKATRKADAALISIKGVAQTAKEATVEVAKEV